MYKIILLLAIFLSPLYSSNILGHIDNLNLIKYTEKKKPIENNKVDSYILSYESKSKSCKLTKNGKEIPVFDQRFNRKKPVNLRYRCRAYIKEQYRECTHSKSLFISEVAFTYGKHKSSNLIFGFGSMYGAVDVHMSVDCTR